MKRKQIKNIKGVALENKIGQQKSMCVDCGSRKSTFLKPIKPIKSNNNFYILQNMHIYCKKCKRHTRNTFQKKN